MPKILLKRQSPKIDMNPMVDMAFLLVSFFMLTTTFITEEPIIVEKPTSQSEVKLPEKDMLTITVSKEGAVFFSIDGKYTRKKLLDHMTSRHDIELNKEEIQTFSLLSGFGMPLEELKDLLGMDEYDRNRFAQPGIPYGIEQNELAEWVVFSRIVNPKVRVAINGDKQTGYPVIKRIMDILGNHNITRFILITELETEQQEES